MNREQENIDIEKDTIRQIRQSFLREDADVVVKAYDYVVSRLGKQPDEGLRTAQVLLAQQTDHVVVSSALLASLYLHNIPPDSKELQRLFGNTIADLMESLKWTELMRTDTEAHQEEDMKVLLLSLEDDLRSVVVRVGLRLARLEHILKTDCTNSCQIAKETLDVYVPLARRMGMGALREKLEDVSFRLLQPDIYRELAERIEPIRAEDEACLQILVAAVRRLLDRNGFKGTVSGRTKNLYSLYTKMRRLNASLEAIMDKIGIRIITTSVADCYQILGLLHTHYRPIPGTFDDYIGLPKDNGYQSLHTCVYPVRDISDKPVEFQIRTELMHMEAEFGVAAHWRYKDEDDAHVEDERQLQWLRSLRKKRDDITTHRDFVEKLRKEVFDDHLVVFTEKGRQVRLPVGATVRDFLDRINPSHLSEVSLHVNGQVCSMGCHLRDGDTVEIGLNRDSPLGIRLANG
ncbi:MAG: bifunctional (p)ppGpp synthetase/guanosine-3',5'-bis(diphosphate) 3'-pyrophosphohydrolase [Deltaproteobacteria bacterium]|nr:bifunctional (p)ppGpp synthetase/guanosine-3',5'-bis(diphosphate) 3'-pyrophosphohydrolase [Deltaproteobacteria bacterium]MBW1794890.1 bifunctional (p)ppGpp synthetase/guanosine-3',5'-bis(diphosphate) 3'-pyrophosphohydrolase [Deltaproteobacteria bacterium]MBW2331374.1 bifunctional (p)ppGpp synthetase/guanosine-3',5'-bis(diphosphate) 3'-pyrophosphohydrolase [Deltaproteobacteria bacterium]